MLGRLPFAVCVRVPSPEDGDRGVAPPGELRGPGGRSTAGHRPLESVGLRAG